MAKQTFTLYITQSIAPYGGGQVGVNDFDMSKSYNGKPSDYILLSTVEQELEIPDIDLVAAQIDGLEKAVQAERAESQSRVNILLDRISKLKCITHDAGADGVPV